MNKERGKESREEENGRKDGSKNLERGKRSREEEKEKNITQGMFIMRKIVPATARSNGCLGQKG